MIYKHQYFQLNTESKKVFDENGKELSLTGNAYRMLVFLCEKKHATLTEIGDFLDYAKEYTENHLRQYRYKIETIIGRDVVEYKNGVYSIIGDVQESLGEAKNDRNTDLLRSAIVKLKAKDEKAKIKFTKWPAIISIVLLLLSFFNWPYGYFTLLRLVLLGTGIYYAWYLYDQTKNFGFRFWMMIVIAILFNPIFVIHLTRGSWGWIDVIVAGVLLGFIASFKKFAIEPK